MSSGSILTRVMRNALWSAIFLSITDRREKLRCGEDVQLTKGWPAGGEFLENLQQGGGSAGARPCTPLRHPGKAAAAALSGHHPLRMH